MTEEDEFSLTEALVGLAELEIDALLSEPQYAELRHLPRAKLIELFLLETAAHANAIAQREVNDG